MYFGNNFCGVIDGATTIDRIPVCGYHSQSEWLADTVRSYLEEQGTVSDFPKACGDCVSMLKDTDTVRSLAETAVYDLPSATIAAVVETDGMLEGYVLGDSGILFKTKDNEILELTDRRIAAFSKRTIKAKKKAIELSQDAELAVKTQMIKNRRKMNTDNGYWAIAPVGDFTGEFQQFRLPVENVVRCIIFTDGLTQICDMCGISREELFSMEKPGPEIRKCIDRVKEGNVPQSYAHVKKIDDIGFIVLDF